MRPKDQGKGLGVQDKLGNILKSVSVNLGSTVYFSTSFSLKGFVLWQTISHCHTQRLFSALQINNFILQSTDILNMLNSI